MKEKSMKKSVAILCMGLILGGSVITGCSLVTTNYEKYYGAVACTIEFNDGSKAEITKKDLRIAYASYGFDQYVQNGLSQAKVFKEALNLTSVAITKLDGSAKGGIIFAIAKEFTLPAKLIGIGEKSEDLKNFDKKEFINAIFN